MKIRHLLAAGPIAAGLIAFGFPAGVRAADTTPDRIVLPADVTPSHYAIEVTPDADRMTFTGSVRIDIDVHTATRKIVLNAVDLTFDKVAVDGADDVPAVSFDPDRQTATLTFAKPVGGGPHVLAITYAGIINAHAAGLFALDYATADGRRRALFTQFENSDARRFMPVWDEPAAKATFALSAVVPADRMALSNMPVSSRESLPGGLQRVHFGTTPKMSSYLLFFGVGDFERVARTVNGVDVGVVVKRGDIAQAQFALDAAARLLPYYEDYFGVAFPLPKMDLIAGPGSSQFFSAMENWGALFFFERDLLIDPKISTQEDMRDVFITVAHEMAHQWFGDLVTMAWWDGLWLNEGFASWMEVKATDHFHPEWSLWLDAQNSKNFAMQTDARRGTHPIVQPVRDVLQADEAFDEITYEKGAAVIRMLEQFVGEAAFRDGVRRYMQRYAYGNTVSDDLWRELDRGAAAPVAAIAHDFTGQAGVPLVGVTGAPRGIRLTETRFAADDSATPSTGWHVPVTVSGPTPAWSGILTRAEPADIETAGTAIVNAGQAGYFRTLYAPPVLRPLIAHFDALPAADELGLIDDSVALGSSGYEPLSDFCALAAQARAGLDPTVLSTLIGRLREVDFLYDGLPGQRRFRAFGRRVLQPVLAEYGWTARTGDSQNAALLRDAVLVALAEFDDPGVLAEARARFGDFLRDPAVLPVDLRHSVLEIVAEHADDAAWDQLHALARSAPGTLEKQQYYRLLGAARDPAVAARALGLALTDEAIVTTRPEIVASVARYHSDLAFDFANAHLEAILRMLEPDSRNDFLPHLASRSTDAASIPKLRAYAKAHIPASARQVAVKAEAEIAYRAQIRARRLADVDRWLGASNIE